MSDFRAGRRVARSISDSADFRAALDRCERRWSELCRAERDRVVEAQPIPGWVLDAEREESERRRRRDERARAEREAQRSARLAHARQVYETLPGVGSLRGRWLAALATSGDGAAVEGRGTL